MSAIPSAMPQGITHLEVHESGSATFWRIPRPEQSDGTGDFWLDGQWVTSEISGNFVDRLVSVSGTPAHRWSTDPHAGRYDGDRAELAMGDLTDDMLANGLFLYDHRAGLHSLAWLTAAKERIRWLSRKLDATLQALAVWERHEPWGEHDVIPLGVGSITGEAYRRGVESGLAQARRTPVRSSSKSPAAPCTGSTPRCRSRSSSSATPTTSPASRRS